MIRHALGMTVAATLGMTVAAHAADLTANQDVIGAPAPAFSWTGFYAGVHAGFGWADLDSPFTEAAYGENNKPDGFFGGGQVGYNYQFANNIVLGIEADAAFADLKDSIAIDIVDLPDDNIQGDSTGKVNSFGTVRGRLGYAVDRFLPYATAGFAWANATMSEHVAGTLGGIAGSASAEDSQTFTGWTIGAGVEYAVTNNITAKVEYLYADLGSKDFDLFNDIYPADLTTQTVKFGLNYKF